MIRFRTLQRRDDLAGIDDLVAELASPGARYFVKWPGAYYVVGASRIRVGQRGTTHSDTS